MQRRIRYNTYAAVDEDSSSATAYVSLQAKKMHEVSEFLWLEMHGEHIVLAALAFLNLAMTGVVHCEFK